MTTQAAQLQFTAEFTLFVVAVAVVVIASLRPADSAGRSRPRLLLLGGFVSLGLAAFLHGSLIIDDASAGPLVALRLAGIVALVLASRAVTGADVGNRAWNTVGRTAVAALVVAEALAAAGQPIAADVVRGIGGLGLLAVVLVGARSAMAARIASSAGVLVLLVITALSIAVSSVIAGNVASDFATRYEARARSEAEQLGRTSQSAVAESELLARSLQASRVADAFAGAQSGEAEDLETLQLIVGGLAENYRDDILRVENPGPVGVLRWTGTSLAEIVVLDAPDIVRTELLGSRAVAAAAAERRPTSQIGVVGNRALVVGAAPIEVRGDFYGVAVVTSSIGQTYLRQRIADPVSVEEGLGLALSGRTRVYAIAGAMPVTQHLRELALESLRTGTRQSAVHNERFVVALPVTAGSSGIPTLAMLASVPESTIDATRQDLFQTVFVVALGAALVGIVLAGLLGRRIGAALRDLARAATELEGGDFAVRAAIDSPDELGRLGESFNHMAGSLEAMTGELRSVAEQEATVRGRLQGVLGGMGEALIAIDATGAVTDFNAAAERLVGVAGSDVLETPLTDHCRVRDENGVDITARLADPFVESWSTAADVLGADGPPIPVVMSAAPLRDLAGARTGAVFVVRDMRREREIEEMKTEFISNVSHELRTPLTNIKGFSELLANRQLSPEKAKEFAGHISEATRQLTRVTDQLVQVAASAAGRLDLHLTEQRPRDLLDDVVERWSERIDDAHTITRRVARGTPTVHVDRQRLADALDEIVDNALKYSPDGGRVDLRAQLVDLGAGPRVAISVRDRGVGIERERCEVIFDDFTQGDGSATRQFGGLGLGLSLVRNIIRAHGGEWLCESEVGKGTTVTVLLPPEGPDTEGGPTT